MVSSKPAVLASRPRGQNSHWCDLLRQAGFRPLPVPLMDIASVTDAGDKRLIQNGIMELDQYQGVICVSQNAVKALFEWLDDFWPQLPEDLRFYAVGAKTADAIHEELQFWGDACTAKVLGGAGAMNSEALLALPELQEVKDQRFLLCRGKGGRPLLADSLQSRGARVDFCELYERALPADLADNWQQQAPLAGKDVLAVFSGETLTNLVTFLLDGARELPGQWSQSPVLVPGDRVAEMAQHFGFSRIIKAKNATEAAMLAALKAEYPAGDSA